MNYLFGGERENKFGDTHSFHLYRLWGIIAFLWLFPIIKVSAQDLSLTVNGISPSTDSYRFYSIEGDPFEIVLEVYPTPTVDEINDIMLEPGEISLGKIEFTGNAHLFEWTSSNPAIGTAASGSVTATDGKAFMQPFIAQNDGLDPISSTITVTPVYSFNGQSYSGESTEFDIIVASGQSIDLGQYADDREKVIIERCYGESIRNALRVEAIGYNLRYQWYKDGEAIAGATESTYNIDRVDMNTAGTYYVIVGNNYESRQSKDYEVRIKAPIVEQRWGDVMILINNPNLNGGYTFSNIQWYTMDANGDLDEIPGATLSYLYSDAPVEGITYVVKAMDQEGVPYESCPVTGNAYDPVEKILIYPNPVKRGEAITIEANFSDDDRKNTWIHIASVDGQSVSSMKLAEQSTSITMPVIQGVYVLRLTTASGDIYKYKIMVK